MRLPRIAIFCLIIFLPVFSWAGASPSPQQIIFFKHSIDNGKYIAAWDQLNNDIKPLKEQHEKDLKEGKDALAKQRRVEIVNYYDHFYKIMDKTYQDDFKKNSSDYVSTSPVMSVTFNFVLGYLALDSEHYEEAEAPFRMVMSNEESDGRSESPMAVMAQQGYAESLRLSARHRESKEEYVKVLGHLKRQYQQSKNEDDKKVIQANVQNIQQYLATADLEERAPASTFSSTIALSSGYDTNVNTATDSDTIAFLLPFGSVLVLPLDAQNRALGSSFGEVNTSAFATQSFNASTTFFEQGSFDNINNFEQPTLDTDAINVALGVDKKFDNNRYDLIVPLQMQHLFLDGKSFVDAFVGLVDFSRVMNGTNKVGLYGEHDLILFEGDSFRNIDIDLGGLSWTHVIPAWNVQLVSRVYTGYQKQRSSESVQSKLGRDLLGVNLRADWYATERLAPYVNVVLQQATHHGPEIPYANIPREEKYLDETAGLDYRLSKNWKLSGSVRYSKNISNIPIHTYSRVLYEAGASYTLS